MSINRTPRPGVDVVRIDAAVANLSTVIARLDDVIDTIERSSLLGAMAPALIADRQRLRDARLHIVCEVLYSVDGCGYPTCTRCYPVERPRVRIENDSAHTDDTAPPHGILRPPVRPDWLYDVDKGLPS